jgi:hypothetical protein
MSIPDLKEEILEYCQHCGALSGYSIYVNGNEWTHGATGLSEDERKQMRINIHGPSNCS